MAEQATDQAPGDEVHLLPRDVDWAAIIKDVEGSNGLEASYPHVKFESVMTSSGKKVTHILVPEYKPGDGPVSPWAGDLLLCDAGIVFIQPGGEGEGVRHLDLDELDPDSVYDAVESFVKRSSDDSYDTLSIRLKEPIWLENPREKVEFSGNEAKVIDVVSSYGENGESSQASTDLMDTLRMLEDIGASDAK